MRKSTTLETTKYFSLFTLLTLIWIAQGTLSAQTVSYGVSMPKPTSSLFHVTIEIRGASGASLDIAMPAWSPGAYRIHMAASNVQELTAENGGGQPLAARMVDTATWRIEPVAEVVRVRYKVHAGARALNDTHATLNGTRTLMYLVGEAPYPASGELSLKIDAPAGWKIATGLKSTGAGNFWAPDYDTLIDAPVEISPELEIVTFGHDGATYEIVVHARHNLDLSKLRDDIRKLVAEQVRMMGGTPYGRYVFLFHGRNGRSSGGLEHLNSTTISFGRYAGDDEDFYRRFQFVISHEFFHLWNVKRIRPAVLGPFDYSRPQHTRNLYVSEGMTSYYAALSLARSGVWERQEFYDDLAKMIGELQEQPGHLLTSAEMSSWLTWYRPNNSANVSISYYTKGQIIGALLDLELRSRTQNRKNLDDVFRFLMSKHGLPKSGFEETVGFQRAVEAIAEEGGGRGDFGNFFKRHVAGLEEIDYDAYFTHAGLRLEIEHADPVRSIGVSTNTSDGTLVVGNVPPSGAGYDAGLMPGDVLMALDEEQIQPSNFDAWLNQRKDGDEVSLTVMRSGRLLNIVVTLQEDRERSYKIVENDSATEQAKQLRESWLGTQP